ncbi:NAD-dependent epimerase/dehydratase family protein [Pontibacter ruber]|uniref:NAD-dependent epimerase/dehydratase family protein n=1 Tax=Pontibacter ruber TaxID=1343895 RepID=A0ABW5CS92_9BACT|nr:NAD-dependent epimerase/dehydratase family protein [Pontibacter ruber]
MNNYILITGSAGFIGHHLTVKLIKLGFQVVGLDSINDYYDVNLKLERLKLQGFTIGEISYNKIIQNDKGAYFVQLDLADQENLDKLFKRFSISIVINLAAQAGVRYSLEAPESYIKSNIVGFTNLLECCRNYAIKHLLFASSSSVYGISESVPFKTTDRTDSPVSLYAATKKANEVIAYSYAHLYGIPCTGLRFFTVYGPLGRPDMAYFSFTKAILEAKPIRVFNQGNMLRDFTYIDDIVESIIRLMDIVPANIVTSARYKIYNIGNSKPVNLLDFITTLGNLLSIKPNMIYTEMQLGDVPVTFADTSDLNEVINFKPNTSLKDGLANFVRWYKDYYLSDENGC